MTISSDSRYAASTVVTVDVGGISRQVIVPGVQAAYTFPYVSHTMTADESIGGLAQTYYGDATKWWQIADGNPEIMDWDNVTPGTVLRIPNG
jgi:nucleoid-associated protein YgaU